MIMSTIRKRWNRLVLDIVMARPPPVVAAVCFVFGSVFFIGYFCAHWVDQVDLAAYRPYSIFADNILEQPLLGKLSSVLPVDVVYTWVNGSDPLFLNGLHKLKEEQKAQGEICSLTHCMAASYIAIRSTSNEPEELEDLQSIPSVLHQSKQKVLYRAGERRYTLLQIASGINPSFILERIRYMVPETSYMHQAFWTTDVDSAWGVKWPRAVIISGVTELGPIEIMRMVLPDDQESCNAYGEGDLMVIECETEAPLKARFDAGITKWELKGQTIRMHAATLVLELDTSQHEEEMDPKRFDDNEELRYSLRSLEKFAPWVRRVFIVTNGQIPYWLNLEHPRLTLVTHEEIFTNLSHLPSFSSPAIEVHLHRIPGLSEHFLYLNDDVMFGAEVWPEDFYSPSAGYKVYLAWSLPECASGCPGSWLGDGYCDTSCNTSNCQWDGGDCADNSIESNPDHNFLDFDDNNLFNKDSFCSPSCSDSWLADKFCDYECNIEKCGFDGGDCGLSSFSQLYQLNVPQEGNTSYHIPKGTSVCWMNISSLIEDSLVEGEYSDHQLIRSLSINTAQGILVVMVKPNITLQLSVVLGMESKDKSRDHYFHQRFGMAMGSPLSAVLANLFMEFLEAGTFSDIVPGNVVWLRYVDDILLISPRRFDIPKLQAALNEVEPSIQFTLEEEVNDSLPFLDTLIIKHDNLLKFTVYRKPTNKDDLTHFLSHHDLSIKKGVVIGFYLRALRICSPEFLEDEFRHIKEVFQKLKYPECIIHQCKKKALKIMEGREPTKDPARRLILPASSVTTTLTRTLGRCNIQVVGQSSRTIKELSRRSDSQDEMWGKNAGVYRIPCAGCDRVYIGETSRDLKTRIREHRYDSRNNITTNACVIHRNTNDHLMDWDNAELLFSEPDRVRRKCLEVAAIQSFKTIEQNRGMFNIAPPIIHLLPALYKCMKCPP
ncbi:N-acetylglucosamine-1-phosphotransferase subunits alpha/beta-like isoform X2 [Oratosquilla oratoria]|uniref:N-acetylglucosamine-1-phosphotransferase subunits alpha/beta-like isoform X2 n=1 Tax=Oratosquilla oratoria TaxID=337810 RepID=UPI003F7574C1